MKKKRRELKRTNKRSVTGDEVIFIFEKILEGWKTIKIFNTIIQTNPSSLINKKQVEIIYFLFEHVKPELIIKVNNIVRIIEQLIKLNDYSLFMFIMKHIFIINFDSLNNLTNNYYLQHAVNYNENTNTDKKIILELIKLKIEPKKGTKYYDYYKNLQFN